MPSITFVEPNGTRRVIDGAVGENAMQAATRNGVAGIIGECGGSCICATCHCYVDDEWRQCVGQPGDVEADVLEFEAHAARPESRLACQITITSEVDGLVLRVVGRP